MMTTKFLEMMHIKIQWDHIKIQSNHLKIQKIRIYPLMMYFNMYSNTHKDRKKHIDKETKITIRMNHHQKNNNIAKNQVLEIQKRKSIIR